MTRFRAWAQLQKAALRRSEHPGPPQGKQSPFRDQAAQPKPPRAKNPSREIEQGGVFLRGIERHVPRGTWSGSCPHRPHPAARITYPWSGRRTLENVNDERSPLRGWPCCLKRRAIDGSDSEGFGKTAKRSVVAGRVARPPEEQMKPALLLRGHPLIELAPISRYCRTCLVVVGQPPLGFKAPRLTGLKNDEVQRMLATRLPTRRAKPSHTTSWVRTQSRKMKYTSVVSYTQ